MTNKLTTKQAIEQVLKGKRSMKVPAIIEAAVPLTALKGKTPGQSIYSVLYAENKKPDGLFTQVGRGEFKLNPKRSKVSAPAKAPSKRKAKTVEPTEAELLKMDVEHAIREESN